MMTALPSRPLRLERLESRCLLTAGLFSLSHGEQSVFDQGRDAEHRGRPQSDHMAEVRSFQTRSPDPQARDGRRQDRGIVRSQEDFKLTSVPATQPRELSTTILTQRIVILQPLRYVSPVTRIESVGISLSDNAQSVSESETSTDPVERLIASRVASPTVAVIKASADVANGQPIGESIQAKAVDGHFGPQRSKSDRIASEATESSASVRPLPRPFIGSETGFRIVSEMELFDSSPQLHRKPLDVHASESGETWEIDEETIEQLRSVKDGPGHPKTFQAVGLPTDGVIAEWFGGATGLINICSEGNPLFQASLSDSMVDVDLEATLSLHRSLELFASTDAPLDNQLIRDAVLAAITAEHSDVVSPVHHPLNSNATSIAYSGAALLASTWAVVGRRKRFHSSDTICRKIVNVPADDI